MLQEATASRGRPTRSRKILANGYICWCFFSQSHELPQISWYLSKFTQIPFVFLVFGILAIIQFFQVRFKVPKHSYLKGYAKNKWLNLTAGVLMNWTHNISKIFYHREAGPNWLLLFKIYLYSHQNLYAKNEFDTWTNILK